MSYLLSLNPGKLPGQFFEEEGRWVGGRARYRVTVAVCHH